MRYLFVDTCDGAGAAFVDTSVSGSDAVTTRVNPDGRAQVEALSGLVESLISDNGRPDFIVVSRGPAPFTGLRVGLVTARTLGFAWDVPVLGVDELQLQAWAGLSLFTGNSPKGGFSGDCLPKWVVAVMDARRHEVYAGLFAVDSNRNLAQRASDWVGKAADSNRVFTEFDSDFPGVDDRKVLVVGNAGVQVREDAVGLSFSSLAVAAGQLVGDFPWETASREAAIAQGFGTEPQYLRRPDIQQK